MLKSAFAVFVPLFIALALDLELTESRSLTLKKLSRNDTVKTTRIDDCGTGYECEDCSVSYKVEEGRNVLTFSFSGWHLCSYTEFIEYCASSRQKHKSRNRGRY